MPTVEPIIVSYSELDTFRQCPMKHTFGYRQRWTRPKAPDSALSKGSLYHLVMETHYKIIKKWQDNATKIGHIAKKDQASVLAEIDEAVMALLWDPRAGRPISDVHELIYWMWLGWIENYGLTPQWRVVAVEHNIVTPLLDRQGQRSHYHLKAKIDLLVRDRETRDSLWVVDHKSGGNLPSQMDLEIDDQFGLYSWAMREVGRPVSGALHAANRTQRNKGPMELDTRMRWTYLSRSDRELDNLALDAYEAARAAYPVLTDDAPRYSAPDPRSCGWKCDFKEVHLLMRKGRRPDEVLREYGFAIDKTRH